MAERELAILVRAKDLATPVIRAIKREVGDLSNTVGQGLSSLSRNIGRGLVMATGAAVAGIGYALKAAGDFQAQLQTINTVAMRTPEALAEIGEEIRALSRETGTPLADLTSGYYDLVSAGIDAAQATDVLRNSNTLAIGGLGTAAEGVDLLTTALNSYGVEAQNQGAESERFADIFAKAIERGKVTAAELAASFANIGPMAAANGIEIEELAASYAELTARGIPASEASTMMASAMVALMRRTGDMEKLEEATGKSYLAIAGRDGLVVALEQLRVDGEKAGIPLIDLMGRVEGLQYVTNTTGDALDDYNESLEAMTDSQGTAAAQMSERQQGLNFQLARLKALAHDAAITIGNALLPKIIPKIQQLVEWLATHQKEVAAFGDDVAAAFDQVMVALGKVPWDKVGSALQLAGGGAKAVMDAFLGAPAWLQTAILTGWGLNKLTGGMIGTLVSELGKGLIRGVLGITAGVVNVRGAVVNGGPGGVVGGGRGAGAGRPGFNPLMGALAVASGAGIGYAIQGPEFERQIEEGRSSLARGREHILAGDINRVRAGIGIIDAKIDEFTDPDNGFDLDALAYGLDIGGVKTELQETRRSFQTELRSLQGIAARDHQHLVDVRSAVREQGAATVARQLEVVRATASLLGPLQGILGKNFSPTITVNNQTRVDVSVQEWKRVQRSAETSYSTLTAGI